MKLNIFVCFDLCFLDLLELLCWLVHLFKDRTSKLMLFWKVMRDD